MSLTCLKDNHMKLDKRSKKLGYLTKQAKQAIIENSPEMLAQTMDESQSLLEN